MTNTELLRKAIKDSGLKYKYIALRLGISANSLTRKVNGISKFDQDEIKDICDLLNITTSSKKDKIFLQ